MLKQSISTLKNLLGRSAATADVRGKRFVAVIDCVLNQNARDAGAACFPAMNFELLQLCQRHGVGVLQMPCPEMAALGPERKRLPGQSLREALASAPGRACCRDLAADTADRIEGFLASGCELLAVLGGNPRSPGCAVLEVADGLGSESGIFMQALQGELRRRGREVRFRGMRDHDPELLRHDFAWFQELLGSLRK